jgi:uncharacterized protein YciI
MPHFVYRLIPPRPSFAQDMTPEEGALMAAHSEHWRGLMDDGRVLVFGPVLEADGVWGMAVVEAADADEVAAWGEADPAVASGVMRFAVLPMLSAVVPAAA